MESSLISLESLISEVKNEIFSSHNLDAFVSPSAYDTAWLAMIPHQDKENAPMFGECVNWILQNQNEGGFWGETDEEDLPTVDSLPATLACMIALKIWHVGHLHIELGLRFINSEAATILKANCGNLPRWFVLTFPAMIELAEAAGLHLLLPRGLVSVIANIFILRHHIIETEELVETEASRYFPPLLSYLEALPSTYQFDRQQAVDRHLSSDGSLFQSPSATAQAFISTGNVHSLKYLQSLVQKFPNGVPANYPVDGDIIKLCMVDHLLGLGLAGYFNEEIDQLLAQVYRNKKNEKSNTSVTNITIPLKLFKDGLTFRLLRMHKYDVQPGSFCWFLHEPETMSYMEENWEYFISAMYSIYRATDLSFPGENELEEARRFARKILENPNTIHRDHSILITQGLQKMMKYELDTPWSARLDRLYHRKWIEENRTSPLWIGKASFYRLSCLDNKKLIQLAVENFEFQQSIYTQELEELKGWSKKWRLSEMGFGREKTVYTYFAVASGCSLPYNSIMRLVIAKTAIIVTVADDFYDMEGSLAELEILTDAVKRWDGEGLQGHSKTIFDALDGFVNDTTVNCHPQQGTNALSNLQDLWRESFTAWMVERRWSLTGYIPSMDEYLRIGMSSISAHTLVLPATSFLNENETPTPFAYHRITKLLMVITRLTNDMQSYQKEVADGKMNLVSLHWRENPNSSIDESVAHVKHMLDIKRKEFMQHVMMESLDGEMSESCKQIHLCCMKVFEMFFNAGNLFDSETALVDDVKRSIYLPIHRKPKPEHLLKKHISIPTSLPNPKLKKNDRPMVSARFHAIVRPPRLNNSSVTEIGKMHIPIRFNLRFVGFL